jgi:hypothetical protein
VSAEFNWWLLIVGLVIGAALVWLILADSSRRESEIAEEELPKEAAWIAELVTQSGRRLDPETTEAVLRLHRTYLASLPPDEEDEAWDDDAWESGAEPAGDADTGAPNVRSDPAPAIRPSRSSSAEHEDALRP